MADVPRISDDELERVRYGDCPFLTLEAATHWARLAAADLRDTRAREARLREALEEILAMAVAPPKDGWLVRMVRAALVEDGTDRQVLRAPRNPDSDARLRADVEARRSKKRSSARLLTPQPDRNSGHQPTESEPKE